MAVASVLQHEKFVMYLWALLLVLVVFGIACAAGGIPPMRERSRRRSIENSLPSLLESLSDSVGAGRGIQEAMMEQSRTLTGPLGKLLKQTLEESHSSSFDAALASFSAKRDIGFNFWDYGNT